jgi:tetratricopeptide (TPR) repeat protein
VALTPEDTKRLAGARLVDPEAHDAYLRGTYYWQKLTPQDLDTAQRYFDLALEKDPSYTPAYAGLAWVWAARQQMGHAPPYEAGPKAKAAALRAVELDDSSAGAHEALAVVRATVDWDWAGAEEEMRRALELNPNFANAHAYFAWFLGIMDRIDEAIPHSERSLELDPFNALYHGLHAGALYRARRYDEAIATARNALTMQPNLAIARAPLRGSLFAAGMIDELLADQRERIARDPELVDAFEKGLLESGYEGGFLRLADILAARLEESGGIVAQGIVRGVTPLYVARHYLYAGDYDRAMDWIEEAFEVRDPLLPGIVYQPISDPLRSDPRFQDLLHRMNLPSNGAGSHPDEPK